MMQKVLCRLNACATQLPGEHYCEMGSKNVVAKGDYRFVALKAARARCGCFHSRSADRNEWPSGER